MPLTLGLDDGVGDGALVDGDEDGVVGVVEGAGVLGNAVEGDVVGKPVGGLGAPAVVGRKEVVGTDVGDGDGRGDSVGSDRVEGVADGITSFLSLPPPP